MTEGRRNREDDGDASEFNGELARNDEEDGEGSKQRDIKEGG